MSRRGIALVELMVALVVSSVLALLIGGITGSAAVRLRDRSERMGLEHAIRVSAAAAGALLEPLGQDSGGTDLIGGAPSSLTARSIRGSGTTCTAAADRLLVRAGGGWWQALRVPVPGRDSLLVATLDDSTAWISLPLTGAASPGICPDGSPAMVLPSVVSAAVLAAVGGGSPLRLMEPVELRIYSSSGNSWIGLRLANTADLVQPLAGPFQGAATSLALLDRLGNPAATEMDAALIRLDLLGLGERAGGLGAARLPWTARDSAALTIALRGGR